MGDLDADIVRVSDTRLRIIQRDPSRALFTALKVSPLPGKSFVHQWKSSRSASYIVGDMGLEERTISLCNDGTFTFETAVPGSRSWETEDEKYVWTGRFSVGYDSGAFVISPSSVQCQHEYGMPVTQEARVTSVGDLSGLMASDSY